MDTYDGTFVAVSSGFEVNGGWPIRRGFGGAGELDPRRTFAR